MAKGREADFGSLKRSQGDAIESPRDVNGPD